MAYDSDYYKAYYAARKEKILAEKKRRYETDPRYRTGILRKARVNSALRTVKNQEQRKAARVIHNKKPEHFYYVTAMTFLVNRDRSVLDKWIKTEPTIIPTATYYDKRGRRIYSDSQVKFIAALLHKLDSGKTSMTYVDLRNVLHAIWNETFSDRLLVKAIRETLHGKHYVKGEGKRKVRPGKDSPVFLSRR